MIDFIKLSSIIGFPDFTMAKTTSIDLVCYIKMQSMWFSLALLFKAGYLNLRHLQGFFSPWIHGKIHEIWETKIHEKKNFHGFFFLIFFL